MLALMAVEQTRHFFLQRDGYLTDNPAIGPSLAQHYWQPGNSVSHDATLVSLTGEQVWRQAQDCMAQARARPQPPADFPWQADIHVVDGDAILASNAQGDEAMCRQFAQAIQQRYG